MYINTIQKSADKNPKKFHLENLKEGDHWVHIDIEWDNNIKIYLKTGCACMEQIQLAQGKKKRYVKVKFFRVHAMKSHMRIRFAVT